MWDSRPISPNAVPSPSTAVMIGMPIATSEPNVSSSTTTAASRPIALAVPKLCCWACSIAWPPSSTCRPEESIACAVSISFCASDLEISFARTSSETVANAIVPSLETTGLLTWLTCGSCSTLASIPSICACVAGAPIRPCVACRTIWSLSPDCPGKSCSSRSNARCESVFGSEKVSA